MHLSASFLYVLYPGCNSAILEVEHSANVKSNPSLLHGLCVYFGFRFLKPEFRNPIMHQFLHVYLPAKYVQLIFCIVLFGGFRLSD